MNGHDDRALLEDAVSNSLDWSISSGTVAGPIFGARDVAFASATHLDRGRRMAIWRSDEGLTWVSADVPEARAEVSTEWYGTDHDLLALLRALADFQYSVERGMVIIEVAGRRRKLELLPEPDRG